MADEKKAPFVDRNICIGCSLCASLAPGVYRMRAQDGKSEVHNPDGASEADIQKTVDSCPVAAISWQDRKMAGEDIAVQKAEGR